MCREERERELRITKTQSFEIGEITNFRNFAKTIKEATVCEIHSSQNVEKEA